ncbi:MAG: glycosyltransferase family 4 protein [Thermoplasmata archaeon]
MKIAILVRILWSAGTQRFAISQAKALQAMGHDVELIFLRRSAKGSVYEDLLKDIKTIVLSDNNESPFVPLYDYVTGIFMSNRKGDGRVDYNLIRRFPSFAKDRGYDLIICQDQWAGLAGYFNWRRYSTDYIVIMHERPTDYPWVKGWKRILAMLALNYQRRVLINAKAVISETLKVARSVESFYYRDGLKCTDVFPGLEKREFRRYEERGNTVALLSYWNEVKIPWTYISIFKAIQNYTFIMIGNWTSQSYRNSFLEKLRLEGLSDRVVLREGISEEEKIDLLSKSKFFMRFGQGEYGTSYGTLEALECGTPAIVNDELGISDYLRKYSNSLIVSDASEIDEIRKFIESNDNPISYGNLQKEIRRMIEDHSWENHCKLLLEAVSKNRVESTHESFRGANDGKQI